jgi:serine/threonine protein kinase
MVCDHMTPGTTLANEIAALGNFAHPNVARILGYSHHDDSITILSEPGTSLFSRIHTEKQLPSAEEAVNWARQIAQGMCFLHSKNAPHR